MNHKLSTAVFAQGWLEGQFENMVTNAAKMQDEDPTQLLIATQIQEQWAIVSSTLDELIKENSKMATRLTIIESAFK